MKTKNRFSKLLANLMEVAELKNYTLANELQYDVSYISKWLNGQMLPSAKTEKTVMQGISHCILKHGSGAGLEKLYSEYLVSTETDLEGAIFDHLMAEYYYVKNTQNYNENSITPKTLFFPKLDMRQYLERMRHPVLRRVKSLDIIAMMDLMAMDREHRTQIVRIDNRLSATDWHYPDVHFSMIIDLDTIKDDYIYDVVFLMDMLTNMTHVDFNLYGAPQAYGRAIFTVKDEYSISAMLMRSNTAMSVVVSEDPEVSHSMYQFLESNCTRERLLMRQCVMDDLLSGNDYARSLIASDQRMLFGHMTEHFIPDDLFEELLQQHTNMENAEQLRWLQALTNRRFREIPIKLILRDIALSEFAVDGELEFFNKRIKLTPKQRLRYVKHLYNIIQTCDKISVRMLYGRLLSDYQFHANQCVFLNSSISYLSLGDNNKSCLYVINKSQMKQIFEKFFDGIWEDKNNDNILDREQILQFLEQIIRQIDIIAQLDEQ